MFPSPAGTSIVVRGRPSTISASTVLPCNGPSSSAATIVVACGCFSGGICSASLSLRERLAQRQKGQNPRRYRTTSVYASGWCPGLARRRRQDGAPDGDPAPPARSVGGEMAAPIPVVTLQWEATMVLRRRLVIPTSCQQGRPLSRPHNRTTAATIRQTHVARHPPARPTAPRA